MGVDETAKLFETQKLRLPEFSLPLQVLRPRKPLSHVGDLRPQDKREGSHEGAGLSVSFHPRIWAQLARLSAPTWQLHCPETAQGLLLDAYALLEDPLKRQALHTWGIDQGLTVYAERYELRIFDDEMEGEMVSVFTTREQAIEESPCEEGDHDLGEYVFAVQRLVPTDLLRARQGTHADIFTEDHLVVELSQACGLGGVWWHDVLDPLRYSAPRGVLHAQSVSSWPTAPALAQQVQSAPRPAQLDSGLEI